GLEAKSFLDAKAYDLKAKADMDMVKAMAAQDQKKSQEAWERVKQTVREAQEKEKEKEAEPEASTSGAGRRDGFRYENPGHHDPTSPHYVPGKTPLPADAQAVFATAIVVTGRAAGTGQVAYGLSATGQYYRYSGQNGLLHFTGIVDATDVPKEIRKQLQ